MPLSLWERFRRNHAIEHATMHALARTPLPLRLVARSDWNGFTMYGHITTETLLQAVQAGLRDLRAGRADLAVHPRCGTGVAVNVVLASATYGLAAAGRARGRRWPVLALALSMITAIAAFGQPLSRAAQAHLFTSARVQGARVVAIRRSQRGGVPVHRVIITHE